MYDTEATEKASAVSGAPPALSIMEIRSTQCEVRLHDRAPLCNMYTYPMAYQHTDCSNKHRAVEQWPAPGAHWTDPAIVTVPNVNRCHIVYALIPQYNTYDAIQCK